MGKLLPLEKKELQHIQKVAESIAIGAGKILLNYRGKASIMRSKRDPLDIVTEADEAAEKYILGELARLFPDHNYLSEETGAKTGKSPFRWVIDPLDGTKDFARGLPLFFVNLALEYYGEIVVGVVYIPVIDELYSCAKGLGAYLAGQRLHVSGTHELGLSLMTMIPLRKSFSEETRVHILEVMKNVSRHTYRLNAWSNDILSLCWIARGSREACYEPAVVSKWWDFAPGILLVEEAGGKVTTAKGQTLTEERYVSGEGMLATNGKIHSQLLEIINLS